jgi:hypothetical protein
MTWLQQAFAHAKTNNSRAVMVMQQANMFPGNVTNVTPL